MDKGFPGSSAGRVSACGARDLGSIPGLGRSPGEGNGYPLQHSGLENSIDGTVHGVAKSRTQLSDFHLLSSWTNCVTAVIKGYCVVCLVGVTYIVCAQWTLGTIFLNDFSCSEPNQESFKNICLLCISLYPAPCRQAGYLGSKRECQVEDCYELAQSRLRLKWVPNWSVLFLKNEYMRNISFF